MKWLILILFLFVEPSDSVKVDSCDKRLQKIQTQQEIINKYLDSIFIKMDIDSTLRKK